MSHQQVDLVPCPNWFFQQIMDTSLQGQLAYGSRNKIVVFDVHCAKPKLHLVFPAHEEKVSCVSFCKKSSVYVLASGGDDGQLKVWDIQSNPMLICSCSFERKITAVAFKYGSSDKVFFALGRILKLYMTNARQWKLVKTFDKGDINTLASCPTNPMYLVAGHRSGSITVYNADTLRHMYKLHGSTTDILSLSWRPMSENQLISTSFDGSIMLWTIEKDDITSKIYYEYPPKKEFTRSRKGLVATFDPSDPNIFVTANFEGVVSIYDISEDEHKRHVLARESGGHDKTIFCTVPIYKDPTIMVSYGYDHQVIFWDLSSRKSVFQFFCISSSVQSLEVCPHDNIRLAIGCSDSCIRIWDVLQKTNSVKVVRGGIKNRVHVVAWHPQKEETLAFSDDDGRIGILNTSLGHKGVSFLARRHQFKVYGLSWGPCYLEDGSEGNSENAKQNLYLYSCGDGKVYVHSLNNNAKPGVDFEKLIDPSNETEDEQVENKHRNAICWKPDYTLFAVGNGCGTVDIYNAKFQRMAILSLGNVKVQCLKWHPDFISLSPSRCNMHCWLAVAATSSTLQVYDLVEVTDPQAQKPLAISVTTRVLEGHRSECSEIAWSPHVLGHLASASFDRTVRVWDVVSGQLLVVFNGHEGRVFTVKWSYLDPDVIFSSGDDCFVFKWRISEQNDVLEARKKGKIKKKCIEKKEAVQDSFCVNGIVSEKELEKEQDIKDHVSEDLPPVCDKGDHITDDEEEQEKTNDPNKQREKNSFDEPVSEKCMKPRGAFQVEKHKKLLAFRLNSDRMNKKRPALTNHTEKFAQIMSADPNKSEILEEGDEHLGLFAQKGLFFNALDAEIERAKNDRTCLPVVNLQLWKGNIKEHILEAIEKEELDDYVVSLSPVVSRAFWLEVCEKYAEQLIASKYYGKAVSYLLACDKIYDAINLLKGCGNYRDALGLAKTRLHHADPVITEIQELWAIRAVSEHKTELAANCYIGLKQPLKAAEAAFKKKDGLGAELAARICHHFGEHNEAKKYIRKAVYLSLLHNAWNSIEACLEMFPEFEALKVVLKLHKTLTQLVKTNKAKEPVAAKENVSGLVVANICSDKVIQENVVLWKCYVVDGQNFLQHLYSQFIIDIDPKSATFKTSFTEVENLLLETDHHRNGAEVIFNVALKITSFFFAFLSCEDKSKFDPGAYLATVLSMSFQADNVYLEILNQLFFPFDVVWDVKEKKVKLHAVISEEGGDIDSLVVSLSKEMNTLNVFQTQQFMSCVNFIHNGEYYCQENQVEALFASTSNVDSLLGFFSIYLFNNLKEVLDHNNWCPACHEGSEELENGEIRSDAASCLGESEQSVIKQADFDAAANIGESNKSTVKGDDSDNAVNPEEPKEVPDRGPASEVTPLLVVPEEPAIEPISSDETCQGSPDESLVKEISSHTVPLLEKSEESEIKEISYSNSLSNESVQNVPVICKNGPINVPHMQCCCSAQVFLQFCKVFSACICKDIFAMKHFLSEAVRKYETSVLKLRLKLKKSNISELPDASCSHDEATVKLPQNSDIGSDTENESQMQAFYEKYELFSAVQTKFLQEVKGKSLPNCIPAVICIMELLHSLKEEVLCPDVKQDLSSFGCQMKLWHNKFIN